jgi:predicted TIM-barrel fold metal-dependent hydrolase
VTELPKIISVDDHVVEPPHVWQDRLPQRMRERGPRIERARWGDIVLGAGASYKQEMTDDGRSGDYWVYEDRIIYLHKRHVTIPLDATPDGDLDRFDRSKMFMGALTYEEMRPGCYEPKARIDDLARAGVDGSLAFPTFPRFCGQTFLEGNDHELGLECVRAYNDWMIEEWCGDSDGHLIPLCLIPLWDVELAVAEVNRNAARGAHAVCFSEIPPHLKLPSIHTGYWDPMFAACEETRTTLCMHIGSSSKMPAASPDAPPTTETMLGFYNSMASLGDYLFSGVLVRFPALKLAYSEGQIGWIPYALERADNVWEYHASWTGAKQTIPERPSSYYRGRVFGCFTTDMHGIDSIDKVGEDNICFETDYPHTDTTWPFTEREALRATAQLTDAQRYKVLRGNAIRMLELSPEG